MRNLLVKDLRFRGCSPDCGGGTCCTHQANTTMLISIKRLTFKENDQHETLDLTYGGDGRR